MLMRYLAEPSRMATAIWIILGALLALLLLANWCGIIGFAIDRFRHPEKTGGFSFAPPFFGGVLGCIGCLLCPIKGVRGFAWLPLVADPSIFLMTIVLILHPLSRLFGFPSPLGRRRATHPPKPPHTPHPPLSKNQLQF
jgi:hypothetical protein